MGIHQLTWKQSIGPRQTVRLEDSAHSTTGETLKLRPMADMPITLVHFASCGSWSGPADRRIKRQQTHCLEDARVKSTICRPEFHGRLLSNSLSGMCLGHLGPQSPGSTLMSSWSRRTGQAGQCLGHDCFLTFLHWNSALNTEIRYGVWYL